MKNQVIEPTDIQLGLLPVYLSKWSKVARESMCGKVDSNSIINSIKKIYKTAGYSEPEIIFLPAYESLQFLLNSDSKALGKGLEKVFERKLLANNKAQLRKQFDASTWKALQASLCFEPLDKNDEPVEYSIWSSLEEMFTPEEWESIQNTIWLDDLEPQETEDGQKIDKAFIFNGFSSLASFGECCLFDFCIHELGCQHLQTEWEILKQLVLFGCNYMFPYEKKCVAMYVNTSLSSSVKDIDMNLTMLRHYSYKEIVEEALTPDVLIEQ